jgi:flagellar biosynthetic protein FliO
MDVIQQLTAVVGVVLLLCGTLWWLRRRGVAAFALPRRNGGRRMECLERLPLGPQHALHLIRLGECELLVASSPSGCSLVHARPHQDHEAAR